MLSLGTEFFFAFWIASNSVGLPAGSEPPVRAATSTFLISRANSLPRLASMAAFLCFVVAHFEWPLMDLLRTRNSADGPHHLDEEPVDPQVVRQLRVECRGEHVALTYRDDPTVGLPAVDPGQHLHRPADRLHPRGPDEHRVHRAVVDAGDREIGLERVDLTAERVAPHGHVDAAETPLVVAAVEHPLGQHDHAGAGPVRGHPLGDPLADRLVQLELDRELADRGRLAARDHQRVHGEQLLGTAYGHRRGTALAEHPYVLAYVALQGQHTDRRHRRRLLRSQVRPPRVFRDRVATEAGRSLGRTSVVVAQLRPQRRPRLGRTTPLDQYALLVVVQAVRVVEPGHLAAP